MRVDSLKTLKRIKGKPERSRIIAVFKNSLKRYKHTLIICKIEMCTNYTICMSISSSFCIVCSAYLSSNRIYHSTIHSFTRATLLFSVADLQCTQVALH